MDIDSRSSEESRVLVEQVKLLYSHAPYVLLGNFLASLILFFVISAEGSHYNALLWFLAIATVVLVRWCLVVRFSKQIYDVRIQKRNVWIFSAFSAASGLLWGAAALIFFQPEPFIVMALVIFLAGMISGSVASLSAYYPSYAAFAVPAGGLLSLRLLYEGGMFFSSIAIASLVYTFVNLVYARNMQASFEDAIRLRLEKESLLETVLRQKEIAEDARRIAELQGEAKTRFIAAASHDLRQPMQALILLLDALAHDLSDTRHAALVARIQEAGDNMSALLESLLDYSRLEAGIVQVQRKNFPVDELLAKIQADYAPIALNKGLRLRVSSSTQWVESDPVLLERLVGNLVDNAIKYTGKGGVVVGCRHGIKPRIEVWDSGIGIDRAHWDSIFEGFYQVMNPERDRVQGLGLGLAIVQGLAERLGHRMGMKSVPGRGSVFFVELDSGRPQERQHKPVIEQPAGVLEGMKVLMVDDDASVRVALQMLMGRWGCETVLASSQRDALEQLKGQPWQPDVILADYRLRAHADGVEAILAVRALCNRPIPAVILTGDTSPGRLMEIKQHGYPCLHKPINGARLKAQLSALRLKESIQDQT
jgi:signal transduction histidine kinase/CheY-like chemotaxis protein